MYSTVCCISLEQALLLVFNLYISVRVRVISTSNNYMNCNRKVIFMKYTLLSWIVFFLIQLIV